MDDPGVQDELISQFCSLTGVPPTQARPYLEANHWDLSSAAAEYFTSLEDASTPADFDDAMDQDPEDRDPITGGQVLGSGAASHPTQPTSSNPPPTSSNKASAPRKKFATLGDLGSAKDDDHDDTDDDDTPNQDFFAGGEKSGLAVQNPDDIKRKIIEKARKSTPRPGGDEPEPSRRSHFTGAARTLGGDDTPSQVLDQPAAEPTRPTRVTRILHFWNDGFSIDDGELYRSDDPRNRAILEGIQQGRAPLHMMNVQPGQEVDVNIEQHSTDFVKPKMKWMPFSGSGQRLGSPTPAAVSTTTHSQRPPSTTLATSTESAPVEVDDAQPTITLQIRLGDGSRLTSRFNTTHTIGDVYHFVSAASPVSRQRPWVLMTTFPSKELSDKNAVLGDISEFKRGGVVVQKWQ